MIISILYRSDVWSVRSIPALSIRIITKSRAFSKYSSIPIITTPTPYPSQPQPTYLPPDAAAPYPPQGVPYPTAEANPAYPPPPYPGPPNAGYNPYPPQTAGAPIDTKKYNPGTQPAGWQTTQPPSSGLPPANIVIVRSGQVDTGTEPESYLICSIFSVCFCLIFGIIAIVYSAQVSSLWTQGLHAESRRASMKARGWAISAFVVGSIIIIFNVIRAVAFY
ncbi:uncharacterized protein [Amphiura filiformis]|uniref:uncharacterized protein n=1 Tax=Amphiura filiformis TaxID=82378 RepID=UPI003B22802B